MPKKKDTDQDLVDAALAKLSRDLPETAPLELEDEPVDGEILDAEDGHHADTGEDIPDELVFKTKPKSKTSDATGGDEKDFLEIKLDGEILLAMRPSSGAFTLLLSAVSHASTQADRTQALMNFVYSSFDAPALMLINQRLMSPADDFDIDIIGDIVGKLIKKWAPAYTRQERRAAARRNAR